MASYHLSAQVVKRSEGRSVVAMAAYRAGAKLKDERRGIEADYSYRRGVAYAEIMTPDGSAAWLSDRETLWNYVERIEVRKDAQLAREINMALPHELDAAQRLALVRSFVREQFVLQGMVADFAIHEPVAEKGDDPRNFHVHVLLTLRQAEARGLRGVKTRAWNSDAMLLLWRAAWAEYQNRALENARHPARVDHRSLLVRKADAAAHNDRAAARVLDREPEIHVGPKARKAVAAKTPPSRDLSKGAKKREVRYTQIDRGSRNDWNRNILSRNASAFALVANKTENQIARLRLRRNRYELSLKSFANASSSTRVDEKPFRTRDAAVFHQMKRIRQVEWLIAELEKVLRAIIGVREMTLVRRTFWTLRTQEREALKARLRSGRSRI